MIRLVISDTAVSPGSRAGSGLKLVESARFFKACFVSPGSRAGSGLKLAQSIRDRRGTHVSPGSRAGSGLKLYRLASKRGWKAGFSRLSSRERIETFVDQLAGAEDQVSPGSRAGSGLKRSRCAG